MSFPDVPNMILETFSPNISSISPTLSDPDLIPSYATTQQFIDISHVYTQALPQIRSTRVSKLPF